MAKKLSMEEKVEYNKALSEKYGWKPSWFDGQDGIFDEELVQLIANWQHNQGFTGDNVDGICGGGTYRRILTERESLLEDYELPEQWADSRNQIVYNSDVFPIESVIVTGKQSSPE